MFVFLERSYDTVEVIGVFSTIEKGIEHVSTYESWTRRTEVVGSGFLSYGEKWDLEGGRTIENVGQVFDIVKCELDDPSKVDILT